jgi:hypothetical protein
LDKVRTTTTLVQPTTKLSFIFILFCSQGIRFALRSEKKLRWKYCFYPFLYFNIRVIKTAFFSGNEIHTLVLLPEIFEDFFVPEFQDFHVWTPYGSLLLLFLIVFSFDVSQQVWEKCLLVDNQIIWRKNDIFKSKQIFADSISRSQLLDIFHNFFLMGKWICWFFTSVSQNHITYFVEENWKQKQILIVNVTEDPWYQI